ncbi:hypothetical protein CN327_30520 [Bacillus cereus]|nr:hypothetical protein CN509_27270 [Bacillus cereus]PET07288.1 hypothetical protein CN505_08545 [Bacillus cereus]PFF26457.1 hypothetical protein CN327_30520 [Bacillus cereus]PFI44035.1 hypothetical protein COI73_27335 [Bacillus cereus]
MKITNKILSDFAKVNAGLHVRNYYELTLLSENKQESIYKLAKMATHATNNDTIELIQLKEWEKDFLICQYHDGEASWFGTIPNGYDLHGLTSKEYIIEQLLNEFKQELEEYYYACCYEEYIFKTNKDIYFFSMQVHD